MMKSLEKKAKREKKKKRRKKKKKMKGIELEHVCVRQFVLLFPPESDDGKV